MALEAVLGQQWANVLLEELDLLRREIVRADSRCQQR
jgi:phage terminase Nu1 subunit (DNA packaging protein)